MTSLSLTLGGSNRRYNGGSVSDTSSSTRSGQGALTGTGAGIGMRVVEVSAITNISAPTTTIRSSTMKNTLIRTLSIATLVMAPFLAGCATKKYVKTTVTPINQKVSELDATTKSQAKAIEDAERGIARADERALGADGKADAAGKEASLARKEAADGRALAEQGLTRADQLGKDITASNGAINTRFENLQNFKLVTTEQVLFGTNQSELSQDAKAAVDATVAKLSGVRNYVVELQGFTDNTGSKTQNLELSRRRADALVRYLTVKHSLPLHRIFVAGYGAENEAADNKTRDGRKLNRRVEMKAFASADQVPSQSTSSAKPSN